MEKKTYIRKSLHNGWQCETNVDLGNKLRLKIATHRAFDKMLVSHASICTFDGAFETHRVFEDYSERLINTKQRCTEKNVQAQHNNAISRIPELIQEVAKQYGLIEQA